MALTESDIKIIIAAELKKQGFKDAQKATSLLDKQFKKLGATVLGALSIRTVVNFGKASIKAFSDAQREAQLLSTQLNSINLGFASPFINEFIDRLALATGVAGGDLTNAFISLSQATGDVTTAQKLLQTALDVSLGTGKDLQSVAYALQKAYKGEVTALAKLKIGYTAAELKGKDFDDVLADLQARFTGAAGDAVDTFAGKMARLTEAADQAKEAFGERLVTAIEDSAGSIEELQQNMIDLAEAFGDAAAGAIKFADKTIEAFNKISNSAPVKFLAKLLELLGRFVLEPIVMGGGVGESFSAGDARRAAEQRRADEKSASARLRNQNALTRAEAKSAAAKLAAEKKLTDEKKKQARENKIIDELNKRFEMDRIQIAAALGGQINEVERLRLELMQAILDEDVKRAIILEGQLIKAEAAAAELAILLDSLDELVGDPFADWPGTIAKIESLLKQLNIKIPIETLFAEKGLKLDQKAMTVTTLERMDVDANNVYINGMLQNQQVDTDNSFGVPRGETSLANAQAVLTIATAVASDAAATLAASEAALALIEAENAAREAANAMNDSILADLFASLGLDANGDPIQNNIIINVEGSIISEQDLAETITDQLYQYQKSGKGLLFSSTAI